MFLPFVNFGGILRDDSSYDVDEEDDDENRVKLMCILGYLSVLVHWIGSFKCTLDT